MRFSKKYILWILCILVVYLLYNQMRETSVETLADNIIQDLNTEQGLTRLRELAVKLLTYGSKEDKQLKLLIDVIHKKLEVVGEAKDAQPSTQKRLKDVKSLDFINAYKVGGTLVSSLLVAYSYNYDLNIEPSKESDRKYKSSCVDISGTHHPTTRGHEDISADEINKNRFCSEPIQFMFIREPVERLWAGYNHYLQNNRMMHSDANLRDFLQKEEQMLTPPHKFLYSTDSHSLPYSLEIYFHDDMDTSLVLLAKTAGMSLCDVLHNPCYSWNNARCNKNKPPIDKKSYDLLYKHASDSEELEFYKTARDEFETRKVQPDVIEEVEKLQKLTQRALKACATESSQKAWESVFIADPQVAMSKKYQTSSDNDWVLVGDNYHSLNPLWVCMQAYCRYTQN